MSQAIVDSWDVAIISGFNEIARRKGVKPYEFRVYWENDGTVNPIFSPSRADASAKVREMYDVIGVDDTGRLNNCPTRHPDGSRFHKDVLEMIEDRLEKLPKTFTERA